MVNKNFYKIFRTMGLSILGVFLIRLLLSFLPSFQIDMGTWLAWAGRLSTLGFAKFYSVDTWTEYTPGFLYYLWAIGKLGIINELIVKIPSILADIGVGTLIYNLVGKVNKRWAIGAFFLYTLNPFIVFDGSVWGQIDGILTLFLFLSAYYLIEKKNFIWSVFFWSMAFLIKPQAIAVVPIYLLAALSRTFKWKEIVLGIATGLVAIFVISLPFFITNPVLGLPNLILLMNKSYSYTSVFAFNIWTWVGFWISDGIKFLGISYAAWGTIFLLLAISLALYVFRKKINIKSDYYLLFAILSLCFFVFPTKVHERYLFPFFAFLITSAGLAQSINLLIIYIIASFCGLLNIYYPYSYYDSNFLKSEIIYQVSYISAKIVGLIFLIFYFLLVFWHKFDKKMTMFLKRLIQYKKNIFSRKNNIEKFDFPNIKKNKKFFRVMLIAILSFAFITRIFDLASPPNEYFDEVYHAFTAKVILHGDPKAWEWWNTPPTGFAYEWTHPPLAKLGMVVGMLIFGENSFGWRIPGAILGVGSVLMVYLLAKELLKDEAIGLLSAAVFSLDGLALVMSRIGMNDSYILFFALLSIYLFLKQKDFLSAISFGLAIASKWSAIWAIPILILIWLRRKNKFRLSLLWFLVLPLAIYLLSYAPMFLTGHSISTWWGMQEQMWWYHTGLRATHPYSSPWWSWPFLVRPIYLYTSQEVNGMVARIYAFGNPVVFWFGVAAVIFSAIYGFIDKNKNLGLVVFSYLIFFAPWALSPRIMFLYHYLPSIPFMCIATGYVLRRNPRLIFGYFALALLIFIYFYPHWAGLQVPLTLDTSYYWLPSWR